ncbi:hypothetical protein HNR19_002308 [Nocardioides thalensis]|uniref:DUF1906 domain-containing protein n=1 Tax=Nocardioides thalensis TaxID=1914755 RepID=A0A853C053_9ACTN|nr:hypothetical protein [Nocardioides thalensis]NYJ01610.1 hypothetical protein [Nocardioides thalensis]
MRRGVAAVAVLLLLGGCGGTTTPPGEPDASSGKQSRGAGKDGKDGKVPGDQVEDLAEEAERLSNEGGSGTIERRDEPVLGADISWPQCPKGMGIPEKRSQGMPMPIPQAEYVVVGLTNGPGFTPNPCLADQVAWVEERGLMISAYAVASYPDEPTLDEYGGDGPFDAGSDLGRLRNVGYQQARYNIGSMADAGLQTPIVWIDVEPVPDFEWSADVRANAAVVVGAARAYTDAGYEIGVYSTPYLWDEVVGDLSLGVPEWRAAGETSSEEALNRCGDDWSIQGGKGILGQWVQDSRDQNITCPGVAADLGRWFHQY